jgi:hypothetical protein
MKNFRQYSWWFLFVLIIVLYVVKFGTSFFDEPKRTVTIENAGEGTTKK